MLLKTKSLLKLAVIASCALSLQLMAGTSKATSGTDEDNAYAAKVWQYMLKNKLIGKDRIRSFPFKGNRPHGSIQELISTKAEIEGHTGKLIVKHNYGSKDALTKEDVYGADQAENYVALTIMYQREKGYDSANDDWFWAEYNADGSIINHQEVDLSGRSKFCLACHIPLGGKDREIMNGSSL